MDFHISSLDLLIPHATCNVLTLVQLFQYAWCASYFTLCRSTIALTPTTSPSPPHCKSFQGIMLGLCKKTGYVAESKNN